jgi:hypothetical protein
MPANPDIDTLTTETEPLELSTGTKVNVERLKTRQTMSLLKILTRGAGAAMSTLSFGDDTDQSEFVQQLIASIVLAIPEAEDETIEFVQRMVSPADLITPDRGKKLTVPESEINEAKWTSLIIELDNPELEDLVAIIEVVAKNEAPHLLALGKRLALLWKVQTKSVVAKQAPSSKRTSKSSTLTA